MSVEWMANDGEGWDVLVIGAGPAGSRAAEAARMAGASVLVIERRVEIGVPVQCAEFLHDKVVTALQVPDDVIVHRIGGMVTHLFGGEDSRMRTPGCILRRDLFDKMLAQRAMVAGAKVMLGTRVEEVLRSAGDDRIEGAIVSGVKVMAKVVIGADGPDSTVGRWIGRRNKRTLLGINCSVPVHEPSDETEVFLHPDYPGGYGWLFPKGSRANLGVGVDRRLGGSPKEALRRLWEGLEGRVGPMSASVAGQIPVGGPLDPVKGNVILVGDAAGQTHPITGGGIHQAVECGAMAGKAAAEYAAGDEDALERYTEGCESLFGRTLSHGSHRRILMETGWKEAVSDERAFAALMKRCWIGYKDYNNP
jgi:digeranylgeranylglycerophospholipid reductase